MIKKNRITSLLAGAALLALTATTAWAYTPAEDFSDKAGSAAELTARDTLLDPLAAAIRDALDQPLKTKSAAETRDRQAIAAFYAAHDYQPLWTVEGSLSAAARAVIFRMSRADYDGLDPKAYSTPALGLGVSAPADPAAIADAEVTLSQSVLTYARQASTGRVNPASISENIGYEPAAPDGQKVLADVSSAADPAATLAAYNPPQAGFAALRDQLVRLRTVNAQAVPQQIPAGKAPLKFGVSDDRVLNLRARLDLPTGGPDATTFDATVEAAVKAYQKAHNIKADGVVAAGTLTSLNANIVDKVGEVLANMERWRWMPRDLGRFYVQVNIPDFIVAIHKDGQIVHTTRVVVGKPTNQTPIFSNEIQFIDVNPSWNVPASIAVKEMLPQIRNDPSYFARTNYQVLANVGGKFQPVDPRQVDWQTVDPRLIHFRQPPGNDNALGNIKFMFPNKYAVYLHDTPSKSLFKNDYRAYSHGCVRVMDPMAFADALLSEDASLNAARLKKLIGGSEQQLNMSEHVPVHITYFTAYVDDAGKLVFKSDLYGHSAKVRKALGV